MMSFETKTKIKIGEKEYEFPFPNVGQTLEIENQKLLLSNGMYGELVKSGHNTAIQLLNLIDGMSYFSVLNQDFKADFNIVGYMTMNPVQQMAISTGFVRYWRWFLDIQNEINQLTEPKEDTNGEKDSNIAG